jgi:ketosteroid isomerase-like protein
MSISREQMDKLVNEHFMYEARDDVDGVLASLADDVKHEVIPSPAGMQTDRSRIRAFYETLLADLRGESVTPVRRLYGENFVVDESTWRGHVTDGRLFGLDGKSGPVSFRLLHVFELRDGKISNEAVWCDLGSLQRQLGARPA